MWAARYAHQDLKGLPRKGNKIQPKAVCDLTVYLQCRHNLGIYDNFYLLLFKIKFINVNLWQECASEIPKCAWKMHILQLYFMWMNENLHKGMPQRLL